MKSDRISPEQMRNLLEVLKQNRVPPAKCQECGKEYYLFCHPWGIEIEPEPDCGLVFVSRPLPPEYLVPIQGTPLMGFNCFAHVPSDLISHQDLRLGIRHN